MKNLIILRLFLICMLSLKSFSQCLYEIDIELVVTQPVSCPNGNDGIVTATLLVTNFGFNNHFSAPRGMFINPGSSSTDLMFLTKGYITVNYYVTDPFDNTILCQGFDSIFVGNLLLEDSIRPTTCLGGNDGAVTVNSLNGTPPFQYTWNTSSTNQEITGLPFGRYTCHVTDALGCDSYITSNIVIDSTSSISGIVFADLDSNKSFSPNDFYLAKQMLMLLPDSVLAITDDSGYYHFNFHSNCDNEIVMLNNPLWHVTTDSLTYHVHTNGSALSGFDFGLAPIQQKDSVICTIIGGRPRCSWYIKYYLEVTNVGTTTILNNILHFTNASNLQFDTCDVPYDSTSNSNYFWQIDSLRPFQSMQIQVTDFNLMGGNIPLNFALAVELQSGTVLAADSLEQVTLCSYDPNDKSVVP